MSLNTRTNQRTNRKVLAEKQRGVLPGSETGPAYADDLKGVVRDRLISMNFDARIDFIRELEAELRRSHLSMSAYLVALGIPARTPEELTPTEVGHLIRFLHLIVPRAMPAIEKTMARFDVFDPKIQNSTDFRAA